MEATEKYILGLCDKPGGSAICQTNRKTGILGFLVCTTNIKGVYKDFVENGQLTYLLSYKFSQDHLEIFFGVIRARGSFNPHCLAI